MRNQRDIKDIKLVTSDKRRKRLVSELNYYSHKNFLSTFDGNKNEKDKSKLD